MQLIKAQCSNCNALLDVDPSKKVITCPHCGTPYILDSDSKNNNAPKPSKGYRRGSYFDFPNMQKMMTTLNLPIGGWAFSVDRCYEELSESEKQFVDEKKLEVQRNTKRFIDKFKTIDDIKSYLEAKDSVYRSVSIKATDYVLGEYSWQSEQSSDHITFSGGCLWLDDKWSGTDCIEYKIAFLASSADIFLSEYGAFVTKSGITEFCIAKADEENLDIVFSKGLPPYSTQEFYYVKMRLEPKNVYAPPKSNGGCYIATCVYGSYDCPEVWTLRRFRDNSLAVTIVGRAFIKVYYAISPILVKWFGNTVFFRKSWRLFLDWMVNKLNQHGIENTKYYD